MQNDIVDSVGYVNWDTILNRAKIVKGFFILTDEISDVSSYKQFVLVVCFYDDHQIEASFFLRFDTE